MKQNRFEYFLKRIWPTIHRIISDIFYFIVSLIKGIISYAIKQIGGGYR